MTLTQQTSLCKGCQLVFIDAFDRRKQELNGPLGLGSWTWSGLHSSSQWIHLFWFPTKPLTLLAFLSCYPVPFFLLNLISSLYGSWPWGGHTSYRDVFHTFPSLLLPSLQSWSCLLLDFLDVIKGRCCGN